MHVVLVVGVEREKAHAPVEGHMGLRREGGCEEIYMGWKWVRSDGELIGLCLPNTGAVQIR